VTRLLAGLTTVVVAASLGSTASASPLTPTALYRALLVAPVPDSQLPSGFSRPSVGSRSLAGSATRYHASGEVLIAFRGRDQVLFIIFPDRQDAIASYLHVPGSNSQQTGQLAAPGWLPKPSKILNGYILGETTNGKTPRYGITAVGSVDGNVLVVAATVSTSSPLHGDVAGAISLARFAIKHLAAIRGN
jgi:hypothetical protein